MTEQSEKRQKNVLYVNRNTNDAILVSGKIILIGDTKNGTNLGIHFFDGETWMYFDDDDMMGIDHMTDDTNLEALVRSAAETFDEKVYDPGCWHDISELSEEIKNEILKHFPESGFFRDA